MAFVKTCFRVCPPPSSLVPPPSSLAPPPSSVLPPSSLLRRIPPPSCLLPTSSLLLLPPPSSLPPSLPPPSSSSLPAPSSGPAAVSAQCAEKATRALRGAWPQRASAAMARGIDIAPPYSLFCDPAPTAIEPAGTAIEPAGTAIEPAGTARQAEPIIVARRATGDWKALERQRVKDMREHAAGWLLEVWIGYAVGTIHQEGISRNENIVVQHMSTNIFET